MGRKASGFLLSMFASCLDLITPYVPPSQMFQQLSTNLNTLCEIINVGAHILSTVNFKLTRFTSNIYGSTTVIDCYWIFYIGYYFTTISYWGDSIIIILISLTAWLLACDEADRPVHKRTTLSFASFNSPHVSYATSSSGITPSLYLKWNGWSCKNVLKPEFTLEYIGSRPKTLDLMIWKLKHTLNLETRSTL